MLRARPLAARPAERFREPQAVQMHYGSGVAGEKRVCAQQCDEEKLFTPSGKQIPPSLSQRADPAFAEWIDQRRQPLTAMWSSATAQGLALERRQPSGGHEIALSALGRGASTRKYRPCAGTPQRAEAGGRAGKTVLSLKPPHYSPAQ